MAEKGGKTGCATGNTRPIRVQYENSVMAVLTRCGQRVCNARKVVSKHRTIGFKIQLVHTSEGSSPSFGTSRSLVVRNGYGWSREDFLKAENHSVRLPPSRPQYQSRGIWRSQTDSSGLPALQLALQQIRFLGSSQCSLSRFRRRSKARTGVGSYPPFYRSSRNKFRTGTDPPR